MAKKISKNLKLISDSKNTQEKRPPLSVDDLKQFADFFSLLSEIDKRQRKEGNKKTTSK